MDGGRPSRFPLGYPHQATLVRGILSIPQSKRRQPQQYDSTDQIWGVALQLHAREDGQRFPRVAPASACLHGDLKARGTQLGNGMVHRGPEHPRSPDITLMTRLLRLLPSLSQGSTRHRRTCALRRKPSKRFGLLPDRPAEHQDTSPPFSPRCRTKDGRITTITAYTHDLRHDLRHAP